MSHPRPQLDPALITVPAGHLLRKVPFVGVVVGAIFLVASLALAFTGGEHAHEQFHYSWLFAFTYFLSLALGALIFVLIQFAARAGWVVTVRRIAENVMGTLPIFALLAVPVFVGLHATYEWTHPEHVQGDPMLEAKAPYLNQAFFLVRGVVAVALWGFMGWWFRKQSLRQDETGDHGITRRLQFWAGPGIVVFALSVTFALAFDWIMSLTPHWYSTILGGYVFAGSMVGVLAFMIVSAHVMQGTGLLGKAVTLEHYHDLGKLLFSFVVFWAYIAFSQFMLIWYGNIPEETVWYEVRLNTGWACWSKVLLYGHFVIPFLVLLPRTVKRIRWAICAAACYMLLMHLLDWYWLIMPTLHPDGPHLALLDLTCLLAVGGFFLAAFARLTVRAPLVPVKDPRLPEALAFENY